MEVSFEVIRGLDDMLMIDIASAPQDVREKYGKDMTDESYFAHLFKDGPMLCGQTCAYLATGRGKELRGLFLGKCCKSLDLFVQLC